MQYIDSVALSGDGRHVNAKAPAVLSARPTSVALCGATLAAFVATGADDLGGLGLDELLHDEPDRLADQVHALPGAERFEQFDATD